MNNLLGSVEAASLSNPSGVASEMQSSQNNATIGSESTGGFPNCINLHLLTSFQAHLSVLSIGKGESFFSNYLLSIYGTCPFIKFSAPFRSVFYISSIILMLETNPHLFLPLEFLGYVINQPSLQSFPQ